MEKENVQPNTAAKEARLSISDLEDMNEKELEAFIMSKGTDKFSNEARMVLGKMLIEGNGNKVTRNENKGLNWLKEAGKAGNIDAIEYKTYWDIRYDRKPNIEKITSNLEKVIANKSAPRALNTLGEFNHAQASSQFNSQNPEHHAGAAEKAKEAARYYQQSADAGDVVGSHWTGVYCHEGFGVTKNVEKAIKYLTYAANAGNGQSMYQLYMIHSGKENQDPKLKDPIVAYNHLLNGLFCGVTFFDEVRACFKDNYDVLAPVYVKEKGLGMEINDTTKQDIVNIHNAFIDELKVNFSAALGKDRMYSRPCGFCNDQQIWLVGVLVTYFYEKVIRFNHKDFLKAMSIDLGPVLGDMGMWVLKCKQDVAKEKKDTDMKKKLQVCIELVEKYLETGLNEEDGLGSEKKYLFINKFGPKKCPKDQVLRSDIPHLYSWQHYAPLQWFEHLKKADIAEKNMREGKVTTQKKCHACQSPEGTTIKHKVCSACKQVYYCSVECQKQDWKLKHKEECKILRLNMPSNKQLKNK